MNNSKTTKFMQYSIVFAYLLLYGILSSRFLGLFPFVHSDESWLSGLSLNIAEQMDFSVTETFFDARPRYPHAIKIIFHALQVLFLRLFGYSPESVRLLSLLTGLLVLFFFYKAATGLFRNFFLAFGLMVLFSFDIQFIYASHFARQEILLLLALVICLALLFCSDTPYTVKNALITGCITGFSVGLHPNSFILACILAFYYLAILIQNRQKELKPFLTYVGITGGIAALFVALSYSFDSQFLTHYFANGALEFDIAAPPATRLSGLFSFFHRLFTRTGGTYYVADIRTQFLLFFAAFIFLFLFYISMKKEETGLCQNILCLQFSLMGAVAGIYIIGRFSQLSILFLFPMGWLLVAYLLKLFEPVFQKVFLLFLTALLLFISIKEIRPYLSGISYDDYLSQIASCTEPDSRVLGNLNMNFYFENGALSDYRNLPYVMERDGTLDKYIEENKIEYIFYTDELTYYYEHRPYYNALYGNIMFADALKTYCETNCTLVASFENSGYAPRILELIGDEDYSTVYVYRVNSR